MPKKCPVLRDRLMSTETTKIDFKLASDQVYYIGRNPQAVNPSYNPKQIIKVLKDYKPRGEEDILRGMGTAVSKLQGILKVDARNCLTYSQISTKSNTCLVRKKELEDYALPENLENLVESLVPFNEEKFRIMPGESEQLFPGDFLIFGNCYVMEYIGNIDTESEKTADEQLRSETTEIVKATIISKRK